MDDYSYRTWWRERDALQRVQAEAPPSFTPHCFLHDLEIAPELQWGQPHAGIPVVETGGSGQFLHCSVSCFSDSPRVGGVGEEGGEVPFLLCVGALWVWQISKCRLFPWPSASGILSTTSGYRFLTLAMFPCLAPSAPDLEIHPADTFLGLGNSRPATFQISSGHRKLTHLVVPDYKYEPFPTCCFS